MLPPRGSGPPSQLAPFGLAVRLLALVVTFFASPFLTAANGQSSAVGSWSQVLDWRCDADSLVQASGTPIILRHGALIPHGPYRGCVLMWGQYASGHETFLWMPTDPERLFHVPAGGTFGRDMGGISMTWDDEGQLVVVGTPSTPGQPGNETWRFFPGSLLSPPVKTIPGTPCNQMNAKVNGSPWRTNAVMSTARYQSTLIALCKGTIFGGLASGSTFVLGGTTSINANDGLEFWQALSPRSAMGGSAWSQTFVSSFSPPPHAPPVPNEPYDALVGGFTMGSEVQHESTPATFQLANGGSGQSLFKKSVFVAHDTNVKYLASPPVPDPDPSGKSWIVRPRYDATPSSWEIWNGPLAPADNNQGTAVLMHELVAEPGFGFSPKNRVFKVGGTSYFPSPAGWFVNPVIYEYRSLLGSNPTTGGWISLIIAGTPIGRIDNSAVVLPTGDILVVGGGNFVGPSNLPGPGTPQFVPQLVRPGLAGTTGGAWSVANMAASPGIQGFGQIPRLRGHSAVLLPDGRVFVAGGDYSTITPWVSFTGEVFSPPYLFQGFRPTIVSSPSELDFGHPNPYSLDVARGANEVIDAVVLVRPTSSVFGFDTSQRYIELNFQSVSYSGGIEQLDILAPAEDLGPPGYYMLFVVSYLTGAPTVRVPSEAQFVRLRL